MKNLKYIIISIALVLASVFTNAQTVYTVTKTTDPDPFEHPYNFEDSLCDPEMYGTLQWAVRKVNDTYGPRVINFNISGTGPHTILLNSYLPQITKDVIIDGTSQPGYTGENPVITIDGQSLVSWGFNASSLNSLEISGLDFVGFIKNGITLGGCHNVIIKSNNIALKNSNYDSYLKKGYFARITAYNCENIGFYNNILNTTYENIPTPGPYNYGIMLTNTTNCNIGSTEQDFSNKIVDCYNAVYLDSSQNIRISANEIFDNVNGILLEYGSNNSKEKPMILSYEEGIIRGVAEIGDIIEVFGGTGGENANEFLGTVQANENGNWSLTAITSYDYLIATATDQNNNTSMYSDAILVYPTCAKPTNLSSTEGISTSHTLTWDGTTGVTYNVAVGVKGLSPIDENWVVGYNTNYADNQITISGLDENTVYEFYVSTNCVDEVSHWAGPVEFNPTITSQITGLLTMFQNADSVDLDDFLYARKLDGALQYQFNVVQVDSGVNQIITKDVNYISLLELVNDEAYYDKEYRIKVRAVFENDTLDWGYEVALQTIPKQRYYYGQIFLKVLPEHDGLIYPFDNSKTAVTSLSIEGIEDLNNTFQIVEIQQTFKELISKLPSLSNIYSLNFKNETSTDSLINYLNSTGYFEYVEKNPVVEMFYNDPIYNASPPPSCYECINGNTQWYLQSDHLNSLEATNIVNNDNIVTIAIVDDAVRLDHEDIQNNIFINTGELPEDVIIEILSEHDNNSNGYIDANDLIDYCNDYLPLIDITSLVDIFNNSDDLDNIFNGVSNDGNTYVDDLFGWDATQGNTFAQPGFIAIPGDPSFSHSFCHGTHVAGIAAGVTDNSFGIASISNNHARIIPVKTKNNNDPHSMALHSALDGLIYAVAIEADIVNMSFGFAVNPEIGFSTYQDLIDNAHNELGIVFIASMGNDNNQFITNCPACIENVVAIGATNIDNEIAPFSTLGTYMDFWAPGQDIISTYSASQNAYICLDGTSMSCPMTSALWALMLSINPNAEFNDIYNCIKDNVRLDIVDWDPNEQGGHGLINPLESILCFNNLPPVASISTDAQLICPGNNFHFYSNSSGGPITNEMSFLWSCSDPLVEFSNVNGLDTDITFPYEGSFAIVFSIFDGDNDLISSTEEEILVSNPSLIINNSDNFLVCEGCEASVCVELIGTPPFSLQYSIDGGITTTISNIESQVFCINIENSDIYSAGTNQIITLSNISDQFCSNNDGVFEISFKVEECNICSRKHNQLICWRGGQLFFNSDVPELQTIDNIWAESYCIISDAQGSPLLRFERSQIFDITDGANDLINNPSTFGFSSSQGMLLLPHDTGNPSLYYAISIGAVFHAHQPGLLFNIVDINNPNDFTVIHSEFFNNSDDEVLNACKIDGDNGYWIIARSAMSLNYLKLYRLQNNIISFIGELPIESAYTTGHLIFSLDMSMLAMQTSSHETSIFSFNSTLNCPIENRLSLIKTIYHSDIGYNICEFSPNNEYLYIINLYANESNVFNGLEQHSINETSNNPNFVIQDDYFYDMRLGPDGKIYLINRNYSICVINSPNESSFIDCGYVPDVFEEIGGTSLSARIPETEMSFNIEVETTLNCNHNLNIINLLGFAPYTYLWNTGSLDESLQNVDPGYYSVTITDAYGCSYTRDITVTESGMDINNILINNICLGNQDYGSVSFEFDGGHPPYLITLEYNSEIIDNINTNFVGEFNFVNLVAGQYILQISDIIGCVLIEEFSIEEFPEIFITTETTLSCDYD
ncbi:MAG TPA: S8 family serine peptidase, partial [Bacteroidales bacterium]|nr:S8 family serine peptidase [Bacteroidales bacterium]